MGSEVAPSVQGFEAVFFKFIIVALEFLAVTAVAMVGNKRVKECRVSWGGRDMVERRLKVTPCKPFVISSLSWALPLKSFTMRGL